MFGEAIIEQSQKTNRIVIIDKTREMDRVYRDGTLRGECWMDDLYDEDLGPEVETSDEESWMDDLDEAA